MEQVDAKKTTLKQEDALQLAQGVNEIYAAKGKKVVHLRMADQPDDDALCAVLLGPSGGLRAPTIRKGKTLLVGFSEDSYGQVL